MSLSNEDVQDILHVLDSTSYDELKIETARFRLVLRRSPGGSWMQEMQTLSQPQRSQSADSAVAKALHGDAAVAQPAEGRAANEPATARGVSRVPTDGAAAEHEPVTARHGLHEVRPPMLGTFYRAPKPGAAPFVEVGSRVQPDSVVCIIETMKLMNSVCAGVAGEVVEICLDDAQFADEAEVLLRIRPEVACA
ncbi:MAG: biotin/lipoyl-containing protein [Burkholderiaceae bacterium]|jgi:acetyl-CoA carboxylase biotin carboxyl carrier protein|nr:biotin/lipoyl-containing protein [Burkholderiaceae bacterium]